MEAHIFEMIASGLGAVFIFLMRSAIEEVKAVRASINELNVKIAVIISQVDVHERRISKLETN